jgi:hypothetical protein
MTLKYEIYLRKEAGDFVLDSSCENEEKCLIDYITGVLKCAHINFETFAYFTIACFVS